MSDLLTRLREIVGDSGLLVNGDVQPKYHGDWSSASKCSPAAVVRPADTAGVAGVLAACNEAGQPVAVQGGLTGLSGGATPSPGEFALSLERLNGIEELDRESMTMTVGAGTPLQVIQQAAEDAGFSFPLDLGARGSCNIGGNIATNAGGTEVLRFGMIRNLVLGLEAVMADGTVISAMNKMLKNNAGYDLKQLFIGTEGTLGIVTKAVLRLYPRPASKCTALCGCESFGKVVELLHQSMSQLAGLSTFEVMWSNYLDYVVEQLPGLRSPFDQAHPFYVLIESEGATEQENARQFETVLADALERGILMDVAVAQSLQDAESFWGIRDGVADIPALLDEAVTFDVSVPISDMGAFVRDTDAALAKLQGPIDNLVFGHVGDNNLHFLVLTHGRTSHQSVTDAVYGTVKQYDGSVSAEHGIGILRKPYLGYSRTDEEISLMRKLKQTMDPKGILNPGRVI